jgi:hypothetical protein
MARTFYRTLVQVEVLSEEPMEDTDVHDLAMLNCAITDGDCSGEVKIVSREEKSGKEMAELLMAQGSDPGFFNIDAEGNDTEEAQLYGDAS